MSARAVTPARVLSSCFGLGFAPVAPGTFGSAFGLVTFMLLLAPQPLWIQVSATGLATGLGVAAATAIARRVGIEDPSEVVIDELAGMWVSLWFVTTWELAVVAFFLFRFFDIVKPFPARQAEALPEGWGIMADDLIAGSYALVLTHALAYVWSLA